MTLTLSSEDLVHQTTMSVQATSTGFWFKAGVHWCSAFLHTAETARWSQGDTCAVLCPSIALEQLRGARHQRALARKLAASGVTTLRFSFQGTDNSTGHASLDGDASSLVPGWSAAVLRAVEIARTRSRCNRVVIVARRLGALIALRALRDANSEVLDGVELVLWDPAASGTSFLRDLRARQRLRAIATPEAAMVEDPHAATTAVEQTFEFNRATLRDVATLELQGALPVNVRTHVITARLDRASRAAVEAWKLDASHVRVADDAAFNLDQLEGPELPGYTFNAIGDIVNRCMREPSYKRLSRELQDALSTASTLTEECAHCTDVLELPTLRVQEQWVSVNEATLLTGLLTAAKGSLPDFAKAGVACHTRKVLIMLSTGVQGSAGEGDANMLLARRVAREGIPVLRLDFRGTGESPAQSSLTENRPYVRGNTKDIANAVQFMRKSFPRAEVIVAGICSGAYWAIHSAAQQPGIDRVIAINPQLYAGSRVRDGISSMHAVQASLQVHASIVNASKWNRLLSGQYSWSKIISVAKGVMRRAGESVLPETHSDTIISGLPALDLDVLFPATTRFDLVYSRNDSGYHYLSQHNPKSLRRLRDERDLRVHTMANTDHTFSTPPQRAQLDRVIAQLLGLQYARLK